MCGRCNTHDVIFYYKDSEGGEEKKHEIKTASSLTDAMNRFRSVHPIATAVRARPVIQGYRA